jgi:hypothetical protein
MYPATRKKPLDSSAKYREKYLSNLRLEASNNERNKNANQIFREAGVPPSRPPDMQTTTEKAQDIERLKLDLRSKLGIVTDGVIASQIIGEIEPDQIRFAIDQWATILATGVPSSAFIAYLNRLIQKFNLTEGVESRLQQVTGNESLLPINQIYNTTYRI